MKKALCFLMALFLLVTAGTFISADSELDSALNVEGGTLSFTNDAEHPWQTYEEEGRICAKSGNAALPDSRSEISATAYLGDGQSLCFDWNVDCEATESVLAMWDYLAFYVDDEMISFIHSTVEGEPLGWERFEWIAPEAGTYTFRWAYVKDYSTDQGADCGYLDNVAIEGTIIEPPTPTPPPAPGAEFVVYSEGFDESPEDWWNDDFDGDSNYWNWATSMGHDAMGAIYSMSYGDYTGPLTPDNQACTPSFTIPSTAVEAELKFYLCSMDDEYCYEHIEVQVVEIYENFYGYYDLEVIGTLASITLQDGEWLEVCIDLSDYIGMEEINIAFTHCDSVDQYGIILDDVSITALNGGSSILLGDVDFDGNITIADALSIMRHAMQIAILPETAVVAADYDADGYVTVSDALTVARVAMNLM